MEKYRRKIRQVQPARHRNADYAAMVESLDENVGRLLNYMESRGWRENAVILFLSDNGGFVNECKLHPGVPVTSNAPLRSGKGSCYEGRGSYSLDHGPSWIFFAPEGLEGSGHDLRSHAHRFIHPGYHA